MGYGVVYPADMAAYVQAKSFKAPCMPTLHKSFVFCATSFKKVDFAVGSGFRHPFLALRFLKSEVVFYLCEKPSPSMGVASLETQQGGRRRDALMRRAVSAERAVVAADGTNPVEIGFAGLQPAQGFAGAVD